jgi:hypothetical protein
MPGRQAEEMHFRGGAPAFATTHGENRTAANGYAGSAANGYAGSAANGYAGSAANGYASSAANGYAGSAANGYPGSAANGSSAKQVVFSCASRIPDRCANPSIVDVSGANGGRSRGTGKGESGADFKENINVVLNSNFIIGDGSPANGRLLFSEDSNRNSRFSSASAERGSVHHSEHTKADRVAAVADDGRARFNFYRPQETENEHQQWSACQSQIDVRAASNPGRMSALPARAAMCSGETVKLAASGGYGRPAGTGNIRGANHWIEDQNEALGMNQRVVGRRDMAEAWVDGHNESEQGASNQDEPTGNRGDK